jgi:hypothetical protein
MSNDLLSKLCLVSDEIQKFREKSPRCRSMGSWQPEVVKHDVKG